MDRVVGAEAFLFEWHKGKKILKKVVFNSWIIYFLLLDSRYGVHF